MVSKILSLQRIDVYSHIGANWSAGSELTRLWLARCVWLLHVCVALLILLGWALPWRWITWATLCVTSVALISWRVNNDRCPLTVLEERLRGHAPPAAGEKEPANCVVDSLSRLLGRSLPYALVDRCIRIVTWCALSISGLQLALGR